MIVHVVLLKVRAGTPEQSIQRMFEELRGLRRTVSGMLDCSGGENNSPEGKTQGFTHGFVMTFESAANRDAYLPHPEHRRVGSEFIQPIVDDVLVFDYERDQA